MKSVRENRRYRVMLVEDDPEIRSSIENLLVAQPDFDLIAVADSVVQGKSVLTDEVQLLLLDLGLPDGSGLELLRMVKQKYASTKVIVFTVFADSKNTLSALESGADGYVLKDAENIVDLLRRAMRGEHPISPEVTQHLLQRVRSVGMSGAQDQSQDCDDNPQTPNLTPRERETLCALAQGLSFAEIALNLKISTNTISDYSKSVYRKLGVRSGPHILDSLLSDFSGHAASLTAV